MNDASSDRRKQTSGADWLVIIAGIAAIAWVNWYFFVAGRAPAAEDGRREHAQHR